MNKDDYSVGKINWMEEENNTKESFVYKKHGINYFILNLIRCIFIGFLTFLFYFLPNPMLMFSRMFHIIELIEHQYLLRAFLFAKAFSFATILYANFSIKYKHFFSVFVLTTFILFVIIFVGWEIIYLTENNQEFILLV